MFQGTLHLFRHLHIAQGENTHSYLELLFTVLSRRSALNAYLIFRLFGWAVIRVCALIKFSTFQPYVFSKFIFHQQSKDYCDLIPTSVELRFNDLRYNDIPGITINIRLPSKGCSKLYGAEPRCNDLRYNDFPGLTIGCL